MIGLSKRDGGFLAVVAIVVVVFAMLDAGAPTYAWFLLFAAAWWPARRGRREAQLRARALEETLQAERAQRIEDVARLTDAIDQLRRGDPVSSTSEEAVPPAVPIVAAVAVTPEPDLRPD